MARRWTYSDEVMLVSMWDILGTFVGTHDLGRTEAATESRVRQLKKSGRWQEIEAEIEMDQMIWDAERINRAFDKAARKEKRLKAKARKLARESGKLH